MRKIAVFARRPEPGKVKTRLSPALPERLACDLYRAMLADALAAMAACESSERWIYWTGDGDRDAATAAAVVELGDADIGAREQRGADLGERLESAFGELLIDPGDHVVVMGADCPDLDAATLERALAALEIHDLVLGPTGDGGYYLIGLSTAAPELLRGIAWSTERVFEQTVERARHASLSIATLDRLDDLDTPAALLQWIGREVTAPSGTAPRTAAALTHMGLLTEEAR